MNAPLNPNALKFHRRKRGNWSQQKLADESRISKAQISRWERGIQTSNIRQTSLERLCDALRVKPEVLTREPQDEARSSIRHRHPLKAGIAGPARTVLTYVQARYDLPEEAIIDLAPLAIFILAERHLAVRKANLEETVRTLEEATRDANSRFPYLRDAFSISSDQERIATEHKWIEERRVCEAHFYFDEDDDFPFPEEDSPFQHFLNEELKALGLPDNPVLASNDPSAPYLECCLTLEYLAQDLGLSPTDYNDKKTLSGVQHGDIDFRQAQGKKKDATEEEYRLWLDERNKQLAARDAAIFFSEDDDG